MKETFQIEFPMVLFLVILAILLAIAFVAWLALGVKQWWEWRENQPPESEIWSSSADSLTR